MSNKIIISDAVYFFTENMIGYIISTNRDITNNKRQFQFINRKN